MVAAANKAIALLCEIGSANQRKTNAAKVHLEIESAVSEYRKWLKIENAKKARRADTVSASKSLLKVLGRLEERYKSLWRSIEDDVLVRLSLSPVECDEMWGEIQASLLWHRKIIEKGKDSASGSPLYRIIFPLLDVFEKHTGVEPTASRRNGGGKPKIGALEFIRVSIDEYGLAPLLMIPTKKMRAINPDEQRDISETVVKAIYARRQMRKLSKVGGMTNFALEQGHIVISR